MSPPWCTRTVPDARYRGAIYRPAVYRSAASAQRAAEALERRWDFYETRVVPVHPDWAGNRWWHVEYRKREGA